jgi:hypothetical protein
VSFTSYSTRRAQFRRVEVEQEVRGPRVPVSWLPHRSRVEESPHPVELEVGAAFRDPARELVARLHDLECDVAVPDEHERRVGEIEGRQGALVAQDVLPDRVARGAVVEGDAMGRARGLEPVEELLRLGREHLPRPPRRDRRLAAELLEVDRPAHGEVVVAGETDIRPLRDRRAALVRPRPVADEVAEAPELVRRLRVDRREDLLQRVQVRVDVGDDCDAHRQPRTLTRREPAPSPRPRRW